MADDNIENWTWSMQDERQYQFMKIKYEQKRQLSEDYDEKRKLADKSETLDGKPNPQYPRLRMEADMAQLRYEMAYIIEKNTMLGEKVEALTWLYQRVDILEGAYSHVKLIGETCRNYYARFDKALTDLARTKKEQS